MRKFLGIGLVLMMLAALPAEANYFKYVDDEGRTRHEDVQIFVTSSCPWCRKLEKFLNEKNISYTRYDVSENAEGRRLFDSLGGTGVPIVKIGSKVIHGYDPDRILAALNK